VAVSNGGDELGEQAPVEVLVEFDAIFLSLFQALLEVTAFAELLKRRVSSLSHQIIDGEADLHPCRST
jgi:hypothetical protein